MSTLIELLEETYIELTECESKYIALKNKLEQVLTTYYEQNPPDYIDQLVSGKYVKNMLETGKFPKISMEIAKELTQYVVIQCMGRTPRGIKFSHVGAHEKKVWTANSFGSGLAPQFFRQGEFYIIFCTTLGKIHTWHWAQQLTEEHAIHTNNQLKTPCKVVRNV